MVTAEDRQLSQRWNAVITRFLDRDLQITNILKVWLINNSGIRCIRALNGREVIVGQGIDRTDLGLGHVENGHVLDDDVLVRENERGRISRR